MMMQNNYMNTYASQANQFQQYPTTSQQQYYNYPSYQNVNQPSYQYQQNNNNQQQSNQHQLSNTTHGAAQVNRPASSINQQSYTAQTTNQPYQTHNYQNNVNNYQNGNLSNNNQRLNSAYGNSLQPQSTNQVNDRYQQNTKSSLQSGLDNNNYSYQNQIYNNQYPTGGTSSHQIDKSQRHVTQQPLSATSISPYNQQPQQSSQPKESYQYLAAAKTDNNIQQNNSYSSYGQSSTQQSQQQSQNTNNTYNNLSQYGAYQNQSINNTNNQIQYGAQSNQNNYTNLVQQKAQDTSPSYQQFYNQQNNSLNPQSQYANSLTSQNKNNNIPSYTATTPTTTTQQEKPPIQNKSSFEQMKYRYLTQNEQTIPKIQQQVTQNGNDKNYTPSSINGLNSGGTKTQDQLSKTTNNISAYPYTNQQQKNDSNLQLLKNQEVANKKIEQVQQTKTTTQNANGQQNPLIRFDFFAKKTNDIKSTQTGTQPTLASHNQKIPEKKDTNLPDNKRANFYQEKDQKSIITANPISKASNNDTEYTTMNKLNYNKQSDNTPKTQQTLQPQAQQASTFSNNLEYTQQWKAQYQQSQTKQDQQPKEVNQQFNNQNTNEQQQRTDLINKYQKEQMLKEKNEPKPTSYFNQGSSYQTNSINTTQLASKISQPQQQNITQNEKLEKNVNQQTTSIIKPELKNNAQLSNDVTKTIISGNKFTTAQPDYEKQQQQLLRSNNLGSTKQTDAPRSSNMPLQQCMHTGCENNFKPKDIYEKYCKTCLDKVSNNISNTQLGKETMNKPKNIDEQNTEKQINNQTKPIVNQYHHSNFKYISSQVNNKNIQNQQQTTNKQQYAQLNPNQFQPVLGPQGFQEQLAKQNHTQNPGQPMKIAFQPPQQTLNQKTSTINNSIPFPQNNNTFKPSVNSTNIPPFQQQSGQQNKQALYYQSNNMGTQVRGNHFLNVQNNTQASMRQSTPSYLCRSCLKERFTTQKDYTKEYCDCNYK